MIVSPRGQVVDYTRAGSISDHILKKSQRFVVDARLALVLRIGRRYDAAWIDAWSASVIRIGRFDAVDTMLGRMLPDSWGRS